MDGLEHLLSEKFVEFSSKITAIYKEIKTEDEQFKATLRQYKQKKADLERQAQELIDQWEKEKREASLNVGDG